jgi:hypothetical protein
MEGLLLQLQLPAYAKQIKLLLHKHVLTTGQVQQNCKQIKSML